MTKRMLIDASHAEETRVAVLDGNRLEEFDLESAHRMPLKGNIYLARVVRVEPSLQAAFVEYGGNRHGFLAFGEIHPDYYQIPVADRQRLLAMQAAEAREAEAAEDAAAEAGLPPPEPVREEFYTPAERWADDAAAAAADAVADAEPAASEGASAPDGAAAGETGPDTAELAQAADAARASLAAEDDATAAPPAEVASVSASDAFVTEAAPLDAAAAEASEFAGGEAGRPSAEAEQPAHAGANGYDADPPEPPPEILGGEGPEERERRAPSRHLRHYKIQEVIRRRQIMLVQVVKEERGGKGAALTTYISLAGRFSVLMPNSPRGGGVSRKITAIADRKRLREAIDEVGLPDGMSLIVRTAGAQRPKPEIRRDCEYLLRLWDSIRERTLASSAPALIYEEADLIKRSIRDVFSRDVEEIVVDGEDAFQEAREFMRMLMPQQVRKIQLHRDGGLFTRQGVEAQLDAMHLPVVQLRSGGYIVINQTEALVAIDVNSGRATRERHIEDTAFRTNCEAADEIARQLRLRDLAGLIVIDFIDMENSRHDVAVERRLKDALRHDRARIQLGRISHFGLLEMSRQRLRPSLAEQSFVPCPHCAGRGQVRSLESSALTVIRAIEEEGAKRRSAEVAVHAATPVALYLLNRKRERLAQIEARFGMAVIFEPDATLSGPAHRIERLRAADPGRVASAAVAPAALRMDYAPEDEAPADEERAEALPAADMRADGAETQAEAERRRKRRRRRRGGTRPGEAAADAASDAGGDAEAEAGEEAGEAPGVVPGEVAAEDAPPRDAVERAAPREAADGERREGARRRRGGRGRGTPRPVAEDAEQPRVPAAPAAGRYLGPTPADPFAGQVDDIFAAMEAAEAAAEAALELPARGVEARASDPLAIPPVPETATDPAAARAADPAIAGLSQSALDAPQALGQIGDDAAPAIGAPAAAPIAEASVEPVPAPTTVAAVVAATAEAPSQSEAKVTNGAGPATIVPAEAPTKAEPLVGPAVRPRILGEAEGDLPKRRGWWAR